MARYAGEENSLLGNMDVSNAGYKGPKKKKAFLKKEMISTYLFDHK